ncbi:muscle, skeletal receptor tyrosine protein kinase-like [Saccoglossus kowalevskii]
MKRGNLKIKSVKEDDAGSYTCDAYSSAGIAHSEPAYLTVQVPVRIIHGPSSVSVEYGTVVDILCEVFGVPEPNIWWMEHGITIPDSNSPILHVTITGQMIYTCCAANILGSICSNKAIISVSGEPAGFCKEYNPSKDERGICSNFIKEDQKVFFNNSVENPIMVNENITRGLWISVDNVDNRQCRIAAEKLLCHYSFPDCDDSVAYYPMPKLLCKEECLLVQESICKNEWGVLKLNIDQGIPLKSRGHFHFPNCHELPSIHTLGSNGLPKCSVAGIREEDPDLITIDCISGNGDYYRGTQSLSENGVPCQKWSSQSPHTHRFTPDLFSELPETENFCRNPGGVRDRPWCIVTTVNTIWEYCNISQCENDSLIVTSTETDWGATKPPAEEGEQSNIIATVGISLSVVLTVIILLTALMCYKWQQYKRYSMYEFPSNFDASKLPENPMYERPPVDRSLSQSLGRLEYPRNKVVYMRDLGQGAFGRVFQAKVPNLIPEQEYSIVAVKMLKAEASDVMLQAFNREALLIAKFNHPNIVKLLGVCSIGKPACLILEYMGQGDLNIFLRARDPKQRLELNTERRSRKTGLKLYQQLKIAQEIAAGMVYISERKFVHRDLATRNCLVSDSFRVKISDFGLARYVGKHVFYKGKIGDAIPIRWTAPESILHNQFTSCSDLWSFGILLWEVFTYALQPYFGASHTEVIQHVQHGRVPACPDNTPNEVYSLMKQCWRINPRDRPTFLTVLITLEQLQRKFTGHDVC